MLSRALISRTCVLNRCAAHPSTFTLIVGQQRKKHSVMTTSEILKELNMTSAQLNIPAAPPLPQALSADEIVKEQIAELGLFGWTPTGAIESIIDFFHSGHLPFTEISWQMPWFTAIMCTSITMRLCMLYFNVEMTKFAARTHNAQPQLFAAQQRQKKAKESDDHIEQQSAMLDMIHVYKKYDINPTKQIRIIIPNALMFFLNFSALRAMSNAPMPGFETGGAYWFTNLCVPDQTYIMPVIAALCQLGIMRVGAETGASLSQYGRYKIVKYLIYGGLPPIIIFWSSYFPAALCVHWCTSNVFSLILAAFLRVPVVRRKLNIPEKVQHPNWYDHIRKNEQKGKLRDIFPSLNSNVKIETSEYKLRLDEAKQNKTGKKDSETKVTSQQLVEFKSNLNPIIRPKPVTIKKKIY